MIYQKKSLLFHHLGNLLIIFGVGILGYIYFPFLMLFINPPKIEAVENLQGYNITIPKIRAQAPVIEGVDPWNKSIYEVALEKGIAQAQNTPLPNQDGIIYLFAHSSGDPWRLTRFNTIFLRLGELNSGDEIVLTKDNKHYNYKVFDKKELWPSDIHYLKDAQNKENKDEQVLILQTCTPIGTAFKRLLIFAKPV